MPLSFKLQLGRFAWGIFGILYWSWMSPGTAETPSLAFKVWLIKPWLRWSDAGLGTTLCKRLVRREEMPPTFLCLSCRTAAFYPCLFNEQCLINAWHSVGFQQYLCCCWETVLLCCDGFFFSNFHLLLSAQGVGQQGRRDVTLSKIYSGGLALDMACVSTCLPAKQQDLKHFSICSPF